MKKMGPKKRVQAIHEAVITGINTARNRVIAHVDWDHDMLWFLEHTCLPETLEVCRHGYQLCSPIHQIGTTSYKVANNVNLNWKGADFNILAPDKIGEIPHELKLFIYEIQGIFLKFAKVAYVYNWFVEHNANFATMRNYCPWIMSLVKHELHGKFNGRVSELKGLGPMLPYIREAAVTMTEAFLAPEKVTSQKHQFNLQFYGTTVDMIIVPDLNLEL
jgi:hypothetical protein